MPGLPQFIYFDLGNVLLDFDHAIACRQMSEVSGAPEAKVREVAFDPEIMRRLETGAISSREYHQIFCERTGTKPSYDELRHASSAMFELNVSLVPLLTHLRAAQYRMGILSNTCEAHWTYVSTGRYRIIPEMFDVCVLSFEAGVLKPSPEIYLAAAEQARVQPTEMFFVDDREENVAGARDVGIDAVRYYSAEPLAAELGKRGVQLNF